VPARLASGSYLGHSGKHILVASLSRRAAKRPFPAVYLNVAEGWKAAIRIARTSLARSSPPHGSYQAPESLLLRQPLLWQRLVRPYRWSPGQAIAKVRSFKRVSKEF
jgi:hypothetical protein